MSGAPAAGEPTSEVNPVVVLAEFLRSEFQAITDTSLLPTLRSRGGRLVERALNSDVTVWDLSNEDPNTWKALHRAFVGPENDERKDNVRPWFRCLGLMRGQNAKTAVVEHYYVCLDHKSEHASFYGHIDEHRSPATVRLHFFSETIGRDQVTHLSPEQRKSYLGYVVCRRGNLPLVVRAMLKVPEYVTEPASVEEPVNLLGQSLSIEGVPFMQQDSRYAVCADVAIWILAYTAYRRGISERKVIADIVSLSGPSRPLRPRVPAGLTAEASAKALGELGFTTTYIELPSFQSAPSSLPPLSPLALPSDVRTKIAASIGHLSTSNATAEVQDALEALTERREEDFLHSTALGDQRPGSPSQEDSPEAAGGVTQEPELAAFDTLIDHLLAVFIRSRMPVFLGVPRHALALCGRRESEGRTRYFVHDDQNGPYLLLDGFASMSRRAFRFQSGQLVDIEATNREPFPPVDRILGFDLEEDVESDPGHWDTAVDSVVVATPSRSTLAPWVAVGHAVSWQRKMENLDIPGGARVEIPKVFRLRQTILMGIDYKAGRRAQSRILGIRGGEQTFSSMHLAEWVVVVEGLGAKNQVVWENVYDASSGDVPRLQFARVAQIGLVSPMAGPHKQSKVAIVYLEGEAKSEYQPIPVPSRVGKVTTTERERSV